MLTNLDRWFAECDFVATKGFTVADMARDGRGRPIAPGNVLATKDGKHLPVIASTSEPQSGPIVPAPLSTKPTMNVYDLEVANTHTFFVSP